MIVKIYRNTTTGIKLCEGEYFEHEGFRFCITTVEYEQELVIYAIEYTTGFDAIPPGLNYILRPIKKISKRILNK